MYVYVYITVVCTQSTDNSYYWLLLFIVYASHRYNGTRPMHSQLHCLRSALSRSRSLLRSLVCQSVDRTALSNANSPPPSILLPCSHFIISSSFASPRHSTSVGLRCFCCCCAAADVWANDDAPKNRSPTSTANVVNFCCTHYTRPHAESSGRGSGSALLPVVVVMFVFCLFGLAKSFH